MSGGRPSGRVRPRRNNDGPGPPSKLSHGSFPARCRRASTAQNNQCFHHDEDLLSEYFSNSSVSPKPINLSLVYTVFVMRSSTLAVASAGTIITGLLGKLQSKVLRQGARTKANIGTRRIAYAVYFDHKRQTDPEFRKTLKRNNRRLARAVKEEEEAQGAQQRESIKKALQKAKEEGFPADLEEKESYFMGQVAKGEGLVAEGMLFSGFLESCIGD